MRAAIVRRLPALALPLALAVGGCAHQTIAGTTVEDSPENRAVIAVLEQYEKAMESLDADAVLALVATSYYETSGNTDASDDYDRRGLETSLREDFARTKAMTVDLRVEALEVEAESAAAECFFEFRAQVEYPAGVRWETGTDRTRIRLAREGKAWKIVGGI